MATATIRPIEAKSVHQIQSGQVIVDLCSVVKELVENSLDAGANAVEVRFKNNGLDAIEVQDNGSGISPTNYESLALKHYTSKLSNYDDLSNVQTFGFRGEALSSLCALSTFYITTATSDQAPKGTRLDFDFSGKLKTTSVVVSQKGTTAFVEGLFDQLPVRRKELSKNIKREYSRVVGLLHAYACISTHTKFTIKSTIPKGKSVTVFSTNANQTTRENIANVYGAKTLTALVPLDLDFEMESTSLHTVRQGVSSTSVRIRGHISKPVFGEGRQTPDRQMFFVNGRPCGLPQMAKAINEVYKMFNVSQSPFVFADFQMDTNAYDVNVSPDKRTILLHNAADLVAKLREKLNQLFDAQEQTVPQAQLSSTKMPPFKQLRIPRDQSTAPTVNTQASTDSATFASRLSDLDNDTSTDSAADQPPQHSDYNGHNPHAIHSDDYYGGYSRKSGDERQLKQVCDTTGPSHDLRDVSGNNRAREELAKDPEASPLDDEESSIMKMADGIHLAVCNEPMTEQQQLSPRARHVLSDELEPESRTHHRFAELPNIVQDAQDRTRPTRNRAEIAEITVGDKTITTIVGTQLPGFATGNFRSPDRKKEGGHVSPATTLTQRFSRGLRKFEGPGSQPDGSRSDQDEAESLDEDEEEHEEDAQGMPQTETQANSEDEDEEEVSSRGTAPQDLVYTERDLDNSDSDDATADFVSHSVTEAEEKAEEEARVAALIRAAEKSAVAKGLDHLQRANSALKSGGVRYSTKRYSTTMTVDMSILQEATQSAKALPAPGTPESVRLNQNDVGASEEQRLSLTVSKADFAKMHIAGQFNLGFIIAVRPAQLMDASKSDSVMPAELFIVDQHASDEKYNFERLQRDTVVGSQRLVRPILLDFTAVEEETVIENIEALEKNGFSVEVDQTGESPVGQRVTLLSLPLSKEVTFGTRDLEELIHLLSEWPVSSVGGEVPRPNKVRKMFAMRACRSSIMIGKTLSRRQMAAILTNMGTIDKPWNCPHGRPTMRHLTSLDRLGLWKEGDGRADFNAADEPPANTWVSYVA